MTQPLYKQGQDLGQNLGDAIKGAVSGALQTAAVEVRAELARATARRDAIQAQLDATTSRSQQRSLQAQLEKANVEVDKLTEAATKLESKAGGLSVADGPGRTFGSSTAPPPALPSNPDYIPEQMIITVVGIVFIGFPLSIAFARLLWRRATHIGAPAQPAQMSADQGQRFDRLEQAVDAVAIEIERISENQRYLTKVLADGQEKS
jgi:hypothetical protein